MKKLMFYSSSFLGSLVISMLGFELSVHASDGFVNRETIEDFDKNISKDNEAITKKLSDIKSLQSKLEKDIAQYGQTSNQVKDDQEKLKSLRMDLIDPKVDLYKNTLEKQIESGKSIETLPGC